jgi:photosystem II stability/assembly factor-like uncharacterized protein
MFMKYEIATLMMMILSLSASGTSNAQWVQQNSGIGANLSDVVMLSSSTAIAVGRNGSILRTSNSGATWTDVAAPLSYIQPWSAVSFYDTSNGIVAGDHGVVLMTSNGGKSWSWRQVMRDQKCLSALHAGPGAVHVGSDSGWVFSTSDTGRTWKAEKISEWPIRALFTYRGPTLMGVSKYALTPYSLCTQFVVPSPSWSESILPNFRGLGSEAFSAEYCNGGGSGFIVGIQGDLRAAPAILRRTMSDTAWLQCPTGIMRDGSYLGVSAPSERVVYVCGSGGMILRSANGGENWIDQKQQTSRNLNAIFFFDENNGFVVGDSGLILHTTNGGLTGLGHEAALVPSHVALHQNYPNPFNPGTTIEFALPSASNVSLKVFDVLGQEVAALIENRLAAGTYRVQWNAHAMAGGTYFYRLVADAYCETRKLVLLK